MRILFIDRSTGLDTVNDLKTKPRGGMINSLFQVTDYLSYIGHDVTVLSDIKNKGTTSCGVKWVSDLYTNTYDCLVCNRGIGDGYPDIKAKKRILWTHDLPHSGFIQNPKNIKAFNFTVFMSRYAERIWRTFYKDIDKSVYIPNGVDKDLFYPREKDLNSLIYFSHPNRGLRKLPLIADSIAARLKKPITFKAFCNAEKMYPFDQDVRDHATESSLPYEASEVLQVLDPIPQQRLAEEVGQAGLMIMPSGYPEICSNNVLQALASGTPIITTGNLGATSEWVKHRKNGMLTEFLPNDYMVHSVEMVRNAVEVLENESLHRKLIKNAAKTKIFSWTEIGRQWEKLITSV